jgi:hypothetical protein
MSMRCCACCELDGVGPALGDAAPAVIGSLLHRIETCRAGDGDVEGYW